MPRRPRPASRRPPAPIAQQASAAKRGLQLQPAREARQPSEELEDPAFASASGSEDFFEDGDKGSVLLGNVPEGDEDSASEDEVLDVDGARVAQWVDDDELDQASEVESEGKSDASEEEPRHTAEEAADALASLPFGALRKAQRELARTSALGASDEGEDSQEDDSEEEEAPSHYDVKGKGRAAEELPKPKKEIPKRPHKHAPMEVSSKKPVPRKKLDVGGEKVVPRDPRFLPMTGEFSSKRFRSQYGFLSDMHSQEMHTLKENLKRARKLLATSPRHLREEREQEVQRLERAYKRAESMVSKDRQEKIEQEALERAAKEEKEKRKAGKKAWYMKNSDKKDMLLRAKYEALAASGGRGAVKKAIDKRQKKASQQEKKRRPFAPGSAGMQRKRPRINDDQGPQSRKRQRVG